MAPIGRPGAADPYERLGLAPGAPLPEVKRAYRRLAIHLHPDQAGSAGLQRFLAVKAAYEWIMAHPSFAEPGDHRVPSMAERSAPPAAPRSNWQGGRWYWEGILARASAR